MPCLRLYFSGRTGLFAATASATFVALLAVPHAAQAASIVVTGSAPLQATNFNTSVSLAKFDSSLGTLTSIGFRLTGVVVQGNAKFESFDSNPATITTQITALLTLQRPDNSTLLTVLPSVSSTVNVTG